MGSDEPQRAAEQEEEGRLRALGIELLSEAEHPAIYSEYIQLARGIEAAQRQIIGLWPADPHVGIPALAVHVGLALADITSSTVSYVDANVHQPAARPLLEQGLLPPTDKREDFATLWLRGMLAVMVPRYIGKAGAGVTSLRIALDDSRDIFGHILVDMTGFDAIGDHLAAVDLLDGVVIVAATSRSSDVDLLKIQTQIPADKLVGAALVG